MPRAIWSGAISFGLVSIPVKLYTATSSQTVRFHQLDGETGARVRQQRVSEADGEVVPYDRIVKGYELASGQHVLVTDEEMASLDPQASRTVDLLEFVDQSSIDPLYYDSAYFLGPDPATIKPYALLLEAMASAGKVGIARFVMRGREHLCAIRPDEGALVLSTMRYADEVRSVGDIAELDDVAQISLSDGELTMAGQLISSLDAEFDPERYHDTYREKVLAMIEAKQRGDDAVVEAPEADEGGTVVDLMAALEASVAEAKAARGRHPTGSDNESAAPAKKSAAKKTAARKAPAKKTAATKAAPAKKKAAAKKSSPQRKSA